MSRVHVILNPAAGNGRAARKAPAFFDALRAAGHDVSLTRTGAPGDATDLARRAAETFDFIVAAGGDGTVREVMEGAMGSDAAVAVACLGTGNDFAKMLGAPAAAAAFAQAIRTENRVRADLGRVRWEGASGASGETIFANVLGAGFSGAVCGYIDRFKLLRGQLAYVGAILRTLRSWDKPPVKIVRHNEDGTTEVLHNDRFLMAEICNGHTIAGGFKVCPDADVQDGTLDLCAVGLVSGLRVLRLLPSATRGTHGSEPEVTLTTGSRITIESESPLPVHTDGDILAFDVRYLEAEILPDAVWVLGPGLAAQ